MSEWRYPPRSRPRAVEGGLRARGAISRTWWSDRFIAVLEDIGMASRLQRGRSYARGGQVISLDIAAGTVSAQVQGSRSRPYRVRIGLGAFGKSEWAGLERALAGDAWYAAALLAGQMPDDIEEVFAGLGLTLFPATAGDLSLDCSCPDGQVPCKHIAAVFYLLAEAFDEDPFAILAWRGRDRDDLLDNLRAARSGGMPAADRAERAGLPLADCLDSYFALQAPIPPVVPAATASAALLDQVPPLDLAVRGRPLPDLLRPAYLAFGRDGEPLPPPRPLPAAPGPAAGPGAAGHPGRCPSLSTAPQSWQTRHAQHAGSPPPTSPSPVPAAACGPPAAGRASAAGSRRRRKGRSAPIASPRARDRPALRPGPGGQLIWLGYSAE